MKLRLVGQNVHVRRKEEADHYAGSILLRPENTKDHLREMMEGTVLGVGPGLVSKTGHRQPLGVKVGDRVLFSGTAWFERPMQLAKDELILQENDIVGVIGG